MAHFRRWGAVYVLLLLFTGSLAAQFCTQLIDFRNTSEEHGRPFTWSGYWPHFLANTFENWQSEWLQLVFQAILLLGAKHWIFRVDAENTERIESKIDDLRAYLIPPERRTPPPGD
ncbi:DUF6766 family protein [Nocardia abscessus]|uniref:DUF6766 family protein n=1 Tax=Nocardia abscessus TaxID=120957 RepID=UPI002458C84F|nr:DUF6766 family protein [Nocardia abscessus]